MLKKPPSSALLATAALAFSRRVGVVKRAVPLLVALPAVFLK